MSATPSNPNEPKDKLKKELNNALLWAVLAAAFAGGMFVYSGKVEPEKKNFYLLGGAIGAIIAAVNGYGAYTLAQKAKQPPK
jgi:hypothetical protein